MDDKKPLKSTEKAVSSLKLKPVLNYDYFANDILKVWDQFIQSSKLKYLRYDESSAEQILVSLFSIENIMTPLFAAAIIVNEKEDLQLFNQNVAATNDKHIKNETNKEKQKTDSDYSVSLCQAVDPHEDLTYLLTAFSQIQLWQTKEKIKINSHATLFPYHQSPGHWNLGVL